MKQKIKVLTKGDTKLPKIIDKGDWIDLTAAEETSFLCPHAMCLHKKKNSDTETVDKFRDVVFDFKIISLGVAMQLPKGFEAVVVPRSSLFNKKGILQANSFGVIDNSYCNSNDVWGFPAIALRTTVIPKGFRLCQFRIQPSQKATFWQKLKWLLCSGVEIVPVSSLDDNEQRGGFGKGTEYLDKDADDKETDKQTTGQA